jgi:hypothetical protein
VVVAFFRTCGRPPTRAPDRRPRTVPRHRSRHRPAGLGRRPRPRRPGGWRCGSGHQRVRGRTSVSPLVPISPLGDERLRPPRCLGLSLCPRIPQSCHRCLLLRRRTSLSFWVLSRFEGHRLGDHSRRARTSHWPLTCVRRAIGWLASPKRRIELRRVPARRDPRGCRSSALLFGGTGLQNLDP